MEKFNEGTVLGNSVLDMSYLNSLFAIPIKVLSGLLGWALVSTGDSNVQVTTAMGLEETPQGGGEQKAWIYPCTLQIWRELVFAYIFSVKCETESPIESWGHVLEF